MPIEWLDEPQKSVSGRPLYDDPNGGQSGQNSKIEWLDDDAINERVAQAHDASNDLQVGQGGILPISYLHRSGKVEDGTRQFDSNAGILGVMKNAAALPGDVYSGKTQVFDETGRTSKDVIGRSFDLAGMVGSTNFVNPVVKSLTPNVGKVAAQNVDDAGKYSIDLSRGQATGRFADQAYEQDVLTGGRGAGAQSVLDAQRLNQAKQIQSAAEGLTDNLSPSRTNDAFEAVDNVAGALKSQANAAKTKANSLYKSAEKSDAFIDSEAVSGLSKRFLEGLDELGAMEGAAVAKEFPTAARVLNRIKGMLGKSPFNKDAPDDVVGVGWQNIERVRRMLNGLGSTPDEGRVLKAMRGKLDGWIEDTAYDSLVSGDPKFLDDLKGARQAWKEYKSITKNSSNIIQKMADGSANSEQIASWLYGASKVGGRKDSSNTLREIKKLIGADNPAIDDLRRGVSMRLFQDRQGEMKPAGKLAGDILEFVNNTGHELAKELYGDDQLNNLRRFAAVLKQTVPDPKATNPSRSGATVTRQVWDGLTSLAPILGVASSGIGGMLAGFGIKVGANQAAKRTVSNMINKPIPSQLSLPPAPRGTIAPMSRGLFLAQERNAPQPLVLDLKKSAY